MPVARSTSSREVLIGVPIVLASSEERSMQI